MTYSTLISRHSTAAVSRMYLEIPDEYDYIPDDDINVFRKLINRQFADISAVINFQFVDHEPYGQNPKLKDMLPDFRKGIIKIHTTGNESKIWGKFHNLQFRAIHDYLHLMHNLDFTHDDECKVYGKQFEFSLRYATQFPHLNWDTYNGILRSEIVYQSAYKEFFGEFHIDQKIILKDLC